MQGENGRGLTRPCSQTAFLQGLETSRQGVETGGLLIMCSTCSNTVM